MATKKIYPETVMKILLAEQGNCEKPAGSNNVKYNTWFYGRPVSGSSYPWCCAFVCWGFHQAGAAKLFNDGKKVAGTQTTQAWSNQHKDQIVSKSNGRYGDIVLFHFGANHVHHIGMIIKKNSNGTYQCIEGNTSVSSNDNGGKVMIRTRSQSDMDRIIRPKYDIHPKIKVTGPTRVFKDMSVKSGTLWKVDEDSTVYFVKDMKNGWSKVISLMDGTVGYIKNSKLGKSGLSKYKTATVIVAAAFRKNNSKNASKIQKDNIKVGTKVKVISRGTSWSNVIYKGKGGYIATRKLKF